MRIALLALLGVVAWSSANAQENFAAYEPAFSAARNQINSGQVKEGLGQLSSLLQRVDPAKEPTVYALLSFQLADYLHQIESYSDESAVLNNLLSKKITGSNIYLAQNALFLLGRNLAFTGKADEGEKLLKSLGGEPRWVLSPEQRRGARVLARIEFDRGNISQAAIWIRRALVGAAVDQKASSEEIVDTLTDYAAYLRLIKRPFESYDLLNKLIPVYEQTFHHRSPKYLRFVRELLETSRSVGNFAVSDQAYKILKENAAAVDIPAASVRGSLFYQELYSAAMSSSGDAGNPSLANRLRELSQAYPEWIKQADARISFAYFALLAGDWELADDFAKLPTGQNAAIQYQAYEKFIRSYIFARREDFAASLTNLEQALDKIIEYHHVFAGEFSSRLPVLSVEERTVMSAILGYLAPQAKSAQQADTIFRLFQFLNRDKAKQSLSARVARQTVKSDVLKEDLRTRDRLKDFRERLLSEATSQLVGRMLPVRPYGEGASKNDYALLTRLEEIEDKIVTVNGTVSSEIPDFEKRSTDSIVALSTADGLLGSEEALVTHVILPGKGLATSCITQNTWLFDVSIYSRTELQELVIDAKLLTAALQGTHEPSAQQDSSFPAENAFRIYQATFGRIKSCLAGKRHIFLATDADLISLPWNALITSFSGTEQFRNRQAAWFIRSYAISLLPSVSSLAQLRKGTSPSAARRNFLGVGDPDFKGAPNKSTQIAVSSLVGTRGIGNRKAISELPRLPEAGVELREEAKLLGSTSESLLLGSDATERGVRSRPLDDYKILSFATHALIAGEFDGSTEPSLVFSPGDEGDNSKNDGLLTATEIADITLDANLVILSACNTAAPDGKINSRGLSGLADSFFFAGARSIVVTQWRVFSAAAQTMGTGIISDAINSSDIGVAEALRRTSLRFVAAANEEYLAHPRFWAAFIVAGDGAVAPLGASRGSRNDEAVRINSETILEKPGQAELRASAIVERTTYAIGMAMPPKGGNRAGSYLIKVDEGNRPVQLSLDSEMAASGVFAFGEFVGITGFYPNACDTCPKTLGKSAAVFRLLNRDGSEKWRVIRESAGFRFGADIIKSPDGFLLLSGETDFSLKTPVSSVFVTKVSPSGAVLDEKRIDLQLSMFSLANRSALRANGDLVFAVHGERRIANDEPMKMHVNQLTGTKRYLCSFFETVIFVLDTKTLTIRDRIEEKNGKVTALRAAGDKVFGVQLFSNDCRLEKNLRLVQLDFDKKNLRSIFETRTTNGAEAKDLEIANGNFVLVGTISTFLPSVLAERTMTPEELTNFKPPDVLSETIWDKGESISNAMILLISDDGKLLADKVLHDVRNRSLASVTRSGESSYRAAGSALGDKGWILEFTAK